MRRNYVAPTTCMLLEGGTACTVERHLAIGPQPLLSGSP